MVEELRKIRTFIESELGLTMPENKLPMLRSQLGRRAASLGLQSLSEYSDYVLHGVDRKKERAAFIDAVTTRHTDFWLEPEHLRFFAESGLPELDAVFGTRRTTQVWSAGCSTGEEPYSLAMVLCEHHRRRPGSDFRVLASDVSRAAVEHGRLGIYGAERLESLPMEMSRRYTRRLLDGASPKARIVAELRRRVAFECLNLVQSDYRISTTFDAIFLKNVLVDFDSATQGVVVEKMCKYLRPGGIFFVGRTESLPRGEAPLRPIAPGIYGRT